MLRNYVSLMLLMACITATGQNKAYDFIRRASVSWAADVSNAYQFKDQNISLVLRSQLAEGKIKVFIPGEDGQDKIATAADVQQRIAPGRIVDVVDDNGNVVETVKEADDPLFSSRYFTDETNSMVMLTQLLYVQDGRLKIYIPGAAPKYTVVTSWGEELGQAPAFSIAANNCRKIPRSKSRFVQFDSTTTILLKLDTMQAGAMVKQLYGQNLLQALWPHLKKKQYQLFVGNSQSAIAFEALNMDIINVDAVIKVPVYDSYGNISSYTNAAPIPLDISLFKKMEIRRATWYDPKKKRFYSEPKELILYASRWLNGGREVQPSPVLRVVINRR